MVCVDSGLTLVAEARRRQKVSERGEARWMCVCRRVSQKETNRRVQEFKRVQERETERVQEFKREAESKRVQVHRQECDSETVHMIEVKRAHENSRGQERVRESARVQESARARRHKRERARGQERSREDKREVKERPTTCQKESSRESYKQPTLILNKTVQQAVYESRKRFERERERIGCTSMSKSTKRGTQLHSD
jgi:hypothetical protein